MTLSSYYRATLYLILLQGIKNFTNPIKINAVSSFNPKRCRLQALKPRNCVFSMAHWKPDRVQIYLYKNKLYTDKVRWDIQRIIQKNHSLRQHIWQTSGKSKQNSGYIHISTHEKQRLLTMSTYMHMYYQRSQSFSYSTVTYIYEVTPNPSNCHFLWNFLLYGVHLKVVMEYPKKGCQTSTS